MPDTSPVLKEAWDFFLSQQRVPNETLYHYTSAGALGNILATKRMWATDLRFMNDPDELKYSLALIEEIMDAAILRQSDGQRAFWLMLLRKKLRSFLGTTAFYSISFCEEHDLARQWQEYGYEGRGLALGWSVDSPQPEIPLRIGVVYDQRRQTAFINRMIDLHLESFQSESDLTNGTGLEAMATAGGSLGVILNICVSNFKRETWAAEREYRYIYQALDGVMPAGTVLKTRPGGNVEKPYIETDFSATVLRRVIVGPRADPKTVPWLRTQLDANDYHDTQIFKSKVIFPDQP